MICGRYGRIAHCTVTCPTHTHTSTPITVTITAGRQAKKRHKKCMNETASVSIIKTKRTLRMMRTRYLRLRGDFLLFKSGTAQTIDCLILSECFPAIRFIPLSLLNHCARTWFISMGKKRNCSKYWSIFDKHFLFDYPFRFVCLQSEINKFRNGFISIFILVYKNESQFWHFWAIFHGTLFFLAFSFFLNWTYTHTHETNLRGS